MVDSNKAEDNEFTACLVERSAISFQLSASSDQPDRQASRATSSRGLSSLAEG
jgi:hypothetical protein